MNTTLLPLFVVLAAWSGSLAAQQTALQKKDVVLIPPKNLKTTLPPGYSIPIVDISGEKQRQV
ncbi:MAG: hypothetical protein LDL31_06745, partial [Prosthecobacter sp.]|nr:hypothetical protein [Prosthecobacter sp.]